MFGRSKAKHGSQDTAASPVDVEKSHHDGTADKAIIKRATRTRKTFSFIAAFFLLLSVIFMILVEVGNTSASDSIRNSIYFIRLDLSEVIPQSVPDALIVNTIARTLGLHDFYQVGLWSYCEGYVNQGVTDCSAPMALYWFNPVDILVNQLLAGATIALPTDVTDILDIIRTASNWMFGLFLTGTVLAFVMIFITPIAIFTRWLALLTSILTFVTALCITAGAVIATAMFIIMQHAFTSVDELNIGAEIGTKMFVLMWIAAGCSIIAFLIQVGQCCCCASRRDVKSGRRRGSKKAWR